MSCAIESKRQQDGVAWRSVRSACVLGGAVIVGSAACGAAFDPGMVKSEAARAARVTSQCLLTPGQPTMMTTAQRTPRTDEHGVDPAAQHTTDRASGPAESNDIRPVPPGIPATYQLIWHDEFDGDTLDPTKWAPRSLGPRRDGVNVKEAIALDGEGHLRITTSKSEDGRYLTGMIGTQGLFETTFGYFEARMKVQSQVGHWSAFWLQTPDMGRFKGEPKKAGVEIDIIEYLCNGDNRNEAKHAIHWDGYGDDHKMRAGRTKFDDLHDGFHTFGLRWTPTEYVFYVDEVESWRYAGEAVSHRAEYIILSLEVGKWAGDIKEATLPDSVTFDYVRVFQHKEDKAPDRKPADELPDETGPNLHSGDDPFEAAQTLNQQQK